MSQLEHFIGSARWFAGKGHDFTITRVRRLAWLDALGSETPGVETPRVRIELVSVRYDEATETYQVPLAYYREQQPRLDHALVMESDDPELGRVFVYDAMHDRYATAFWLAAFDQSQKREDLVFHRLPGHELDLEVHSTLYSGEQSNSSVMFGEDSLMKVFRKVTPGRNPDIEVHEELTREDNEHVASLYGWLEALGGDGKAPIQLAMLSQFLRTASDGWGLALASVRDLFAEADLHADEVGGDFAAESHRLGVATAHVHDALTDRFPSQRVGPRELAALSEAMHERLDDAVAVVPGLATHADALREIFEGLREVTEPTVVQRVHGDLHLGQTLRTVKGWKLVDFEGEPANSLVQRARPDSAWRDVAGMLRSFDYAAHAVEADVEEGAQIAYRADEWVERNQSAFLDGYLETSGRAQGAAPTSDQQLLLSAYVADKAVYETVYETRNRPDWAFIPLYSIARLTDDTASADETPPS